ncbi:MAG TPA: hypothetical protein VII09_05740 [Opitutaceae bacterium]
MKAALLAAITLSLGSALGGLETGGANDITAVSGRTSTDYVRTRRADGTFAPETYAFGKGGTWSGAKWDASIDTLNFMDVARVIAVPLASQNYLPSRDPKDTKILIMVYWGTTHAPEHASETNAYLHMQDVQGQLVSALTLAGATMPAFNGARQGNGPEQRVVNALQEQMTTAMAATAAENHMRDKDDELNVMMLGYDSWWEGTKRYLGTPMDFRRQDLLDEIEEDRYFVVLMAYDFQLLWREKKHKLLWETRFSIRQRHHNFDEDLPAMAQYASQYFGQDSKGLVHKPIPAGRVDIGDVKSLGTLPDK